MKFQFVLSDAGIELIEAVWEFESHHLLTFFSFST